MDDLYLLIFILLEISVALNLIQIKRLKDLKAHLEEVKGSVEITHEEITAIRERMEKIKNEIRSQLIL
jgi:hypothetical protein